MKICIYQKNGVVGEYDGNNKPFLVDVVHQRFDGRG